MLFANRKAAGRELAKLLSQYRGARDVLVLGLPRGGVPVAAEVARALDAELDVMIVRKLGTPGQPELAMGAVASGGVTIVNADVSGRFSHSALRAVENAERAELERRESLYRGTHAPPNLHDRRVILVDDGVATGASMLAAVHAARKLGARKVIIAVPIASPDAVRRLRGEADQLVCAAAPESFTSVGQWYADFTQTTDVDVSALLASHRIRMKPSRGAIGDGHQPRGAESL